MNKDKLEQFIAENRAAFDEEGPSPELWNRISKPEPLIRNINWKGYVLKAAAAILIFMVAWFGRELINPSINGFANDEAQNIAPEQEEQYRLLMEAELYYSSRISDAKAQLLTLAGNDKTIINDLDLDLSELDNIFEDLKNDLKENGDNEEVIEAMIQNYRIKLDILEEMLRQMNYSGAKSETNDKHEI